MALIPGKKPEAAPTTDGNEKEPLAAAAEAAADGTDAAKDDSNPLAALGIDTSALGSLGDIGGLTDILKGDGVADLLTQAQDMLKGAENEAGDSGEAAKKSAGGESTDAAGKKEAPVDLKSILGNENIQKALKGVDLENPEKLTEVLENEDVKKVMGNLKGVDQGAALKKVQECFDKLPDNITSLIPKDGDKPAGAEEAAEKAKEAVSQGVDALKKVAGDAKK